MPLMPSMSTLMNAFMLGTSICGFGGLRLGFSLGLSVRTLPVSGDYLFRFLFNSEYGDLYEALGGFLHGSVYAGVCDGAA